MPTDDEHVQHSQQTPRDPEVKTTDIPDDNALALIEEQADRSIRRVWHDGRWFFSVIDVIGVLTDSANPRNYWNMLKARLSEEGAQETYTKCVQLRMTAADGKQRLTDAGDTRTMLRIIQSVPSPKAEPIKQWLAKEGAKRLDEMTRPIDEEHARAQASAITKPAPDASALDWAEYHEQMAALYRRQAVYDIQLAEAQAQLVEHKMQLDNHQERLDEHDAQLDVLHAWVGHLEAEQRLLPELLERLGPQTLTPAHQAKVKAMAVRLHELSGAAYSKIYGELNADFGVARYSDIPDARWEEVLAWFQPRLDKAERQRNN